jgi:hypothetical protein
MNYKEIGWEVFEVSSLLMEPRFSGRMSRAGSIKGVSYLKQISDYQFRKGDATRSWFLFISLYILSTALNAYQQFHILNSTCVTVSRSWKLSVNTQLSDGLHAEMYSKGG